MKIFNPSICSKHVPLYKPTELLEFLRSIGTNPKKGLSQNFLIDGNIIRKIVSSANVQSGDIVLEIGPGPGSLTEALLDTGATVIAVEKDVVLAAELERLKSPTRKLTVHCADILEFPLDQLPKGKKIKVIANLPYHITTPILAKLVTENETFETLTLMVQDEVARRFAATPGTGEYSSFTVFLNFYSKPYYSFGVSRNCFYPVPNVNSAIVTLHLQTPREVSDVDGFFVMSRTAFGHRRKMLRASLKDLYTSERVTAALNKLGINPLARPEDLSIEELILLFETLQLTN